MISTLTLIALSISPAPAAPIVALPIEAPALSILTLQDETKKKEVKDKKKAKDKVKGERKGPKKRGERRGEAGDKKRQGERRDALKKRFDADGDGKLNEAERKALREHVAAERAKRKGDGDGEGADKKKGERKGKGDGNGPKKGPKPTGGGGQ